MAIVQINDPYARGTGARFGESVEGSLRELIGEKVNQLHRQRQENNNYEALLGAGIEENQARRYAKASPHILQNIFSDIFSRYGTGGITKPEQAQAVVQESQPSMQSSTQQQTPQQNLLNQLMQSEQQKQYGQMNPQQALMQAMTSGSLNGNQGLLEYLQSQQLKQQQPEIPQQQPQIANQIQQRQPVLVQQPGIPPRAPGVPPTRQEAISMANQARQERHHQEKLDLKREESEKKDIRDAYVFNKSFIEQTQKDANIGRKTNESYDKIYDLAKSGKTRSGGWFKTLETLGLNEFYRNPATQLAQKEIASLAQGAAAAFNTPRLNAMEVELYENSLVKMGNTPEAMMTIAKNKILEGDALILKDNLRRQIIKENGNKPPYNLSDQVYDRLEPELEKMAQISRDQVALTTQDKALADASAYSPDVIIRVDGIDYQPKGKYWVRVE